MRAEVLRQGGVYVIRNSVTQDEYVGSAKRFSYRWSEHRADLRRGQHNNLKLQNAWNKYGEPAFEFRVVLVCAPDLARFYEQRCLDAFKPVYNIAKDALAPMAGKTLSIEARQKISAALKGRRDVPREHVEYMVSCRGPITAARRARISTALKGNTHKRGKKQGPHSQEHRNKISAALRQYKRTAAHQAAIDFGQEQAAQLRREDLCSYSV